MNPTKAAPGSVFSSTFEVLNKQKKNHHHRGPTVVKPSVLPLGGGGGKTSSDLKDTTLLQKQQKNQSCATGSGSQFKNKEKKFKSASDSFSVPPKSRKWWQESLTLVALHAQGTAQELGPGSNPLRAHALEVEEKRPRMGSGGNLGPCCPALPREATPEELSDTTAHKSQQINQK